MKKLPGTLAWLPRWTIEALPLATFLFAYATTTAAGALNFITPGGEASLWASLGLVDQSASQAIRTGTYLAIVVLPFLVVSFFAVAAMAIGRRIFVSASRGPTAVLETPAWALWLLLLISSAYCGYRLYMLDALVAQGLLTGSYYDNILRRAFLYDNLGFPFFVFAYSFFPIIAVLFFARFSKPGHRFRMLDVAGFLLTVCVFNFIIFDLFSKSHLLVFCLMLASAVIISRAHVFYIAAFVAISFTAFFGAEALISGTWRPAAPPISSPVTAAPPSAPAPAPPPAEPPPAASPPQVAQPAPPAMPAARPEGERKAGDTLNYLRNYLVNAMSMRMASTVPFYVSIFSNPTERCGIEAHTVRALVGLPPSKCVIPTKVFKAMYPTVNWITGFAPAAAHISAYGEAGLGWSVAVMAMLGVMLGLLGSLMGLRKQPLFTAFGVASCTFAYYASQLPITATFTYHHGLIALCIPIVLVYLASRFSRRATAGGPTGSTLKRAL